MSLRLIMMVGVIGIALCSMTMRASHASELSMGDSSFLKNAAQAGHYEIEAAMLALAMSQNQQVKEFAQMMVDEHEQLDKALNELAVAKEVVLPTTPSLVQQGKLLLLKGKEGADFDETYTETVAIKAHEETIELFDEQVEKGKDKEIVGFAQDAVPMLRQHLKHAHLLQNHLKSTPKLKTE